MDLETPFWATLIVMAFVVPFAIFIAKAYGIEPLRHMLGIAVIRDQDDIAIRRAVSEACKGVDVKKLRIDMAEDLIEETARHAIAQHFANANPGRAYVVTKDWPAAKCVIMGNIAVVRPILGHDYMGDHDGIRAVNFEIDREENVLNLRPWAPKQHEPAPDGKPEPKVAATGDKPVPVTQKTESQQPPKAVKATPRRSPARRT